MPLHDKHTNTPLHTHTAARHGMLSLDLSDLRLIAKRYTRSETMIE